jgi:hypothetical protein
MNIQEMIDSAKRRFQDDNTEDRDLIDSANRTEPDNSEEDYRDGYYGDEI